MDSVNVQHKRKRIIRLTWNIRHNMILDDACDVTESEMIVKLEDEIIR